MTLATHAAMGRRQLLKAAMSSHALRPPRLVIFALSPLLALGTCTAFNEISWRRALPGNVRVDAVIASSEEIGLMSGCWSAVYRLSQSTAAHVQKDGIAYLASGAHPFNENSENRYGRWYETPGEIEVEENGHGAKRTFFGLYARNGCSDRSGQNFHSEELAAALSRPGSYYTATSNREGIVIVAPRERLAAYFYFG